MKDFSETDYVVYDTWRKDALRFSNGEIIIYGDKEEAEEDCDEFQVVIRCVELALYHQKQTKTI